MPGPVTFPPHNGFQVSPINNPREASIATRPCLSSASRHFLRVSSETVAERRSGSKNPVGASCPGSSLGMVDCNCVPLLLRNSGLSAKADARIAQMITSTVDVMIALLVICSIYLQAVSEFKTFKYSVTRGDEY